MKLRALSWNVRKATIESPVWNVISEINPDLMFLQEVNSIPDFIKNCYSVDLQNAITKSGNKQKFYTAILVKGDISNDSFLESEFNWVNKELDFFSGNLLSRKIKIEGLSEMNVVSVYSPAWPVAKEKLKTIDVSPIKLIHNKDVWCTEILWSALKNISNIKNENWLVAGDFNSSVTFDYLWSGGPHGNQEIIDRMNSIGLYECLYSHNNKLIPTFRNNRGGKIIHQIDHMYVTKNFLASLTNSYVGDTYEIFEKSISDHLPIISDFEF